MKKLKRLAITLQVCIKTLIIICLTFISYNAFASKEGEIIASKHYMVISNKITNKPEITEFRNKDPDKIQVLMFFNYGCYWCSQVNKPFDEWAAKQENIAVYHFPVSYNRAFEELAKAYYTAKHLDKTGKIDDAIYHGMHVERLNYARGSLLQKLFEKHGIDKKTFLTTFNSFGISRQVQTANDITKAYKVTATPNIIVNIGDKSYITNLVMTADIAVLLKTLDYLVSTSTNSKTED